MGWSFVDRLRKIFRPRTPAAFVGADQAAPTSSRVWCAVANVVAERAYGPGGAEKRRGLKHFAPYAKVYVVDYFWGMGAEKVTVIGHHRRSHRLVTIVIPSRTLTGWRCQLIYKPAVLRRVEANPNWNGVSPSRLDIEAIVERWSTG